MKNMKIILMSFILLLVTAGAASALYIETIDLCPDDGGCLVGFGAYDIGTDLFIDHTYDFSEPNPIEFVTLSIVADDVDYGEEDEVFVNGNSVGFLSMLNSYSHFDYQPGPGNNKQGLTTSVFDLDPAILDWTIPIRIHINTNWELEIESSTLTVQGAAPVPEPATIMLLGTGLVGLIGMRKRKIKAD